MHSDGKTPRHFSMVREFHLADVFTLGNAACGTATVFAALGYVATRSSRVFLVGTILVLVALVFDVMDGRIARWRQKQSLLGRELDSLSDVISFGVAPAALAFALGMNGAFDAVVLLYFVACGVSRLARFNVTADELSSGGNKVKYFEGTPIPSSVLLVIFMAVLAQRPQDDSLLLGALGRGFWALHPFVLLFALSGTLMISKTLRIPKW